MTGEGMVSDEQTVRDALTAFDGRCPNYKPGDLDAPCEPDHTGVCLTCGYWAPLYPADRSKPVLVPQGVMRSLVSRQAALEQALADLVQWAEGEKGDAFGTTYWATAKALLAASRPDRSET